MASDWSFGTTQLLTVLGMLATGGFAFAGLRTFGKWRNEKIEERRIDTALEALSVAYESKGVFDAIRSPGSFNHEYDDMPKVQNESEAHRNARSTYWVTLKRIDNNKEFFLKVLKLQPRFMAVFGPETEKIFADLNMARVQIQISANSLMRRGEYDEPWTEERAQRHAQLEADIWSGFTDEDAPKGDRVGKLLEAFKRGIVDICRPIVDREFGVKRRWWVWKPNL